MTSSSARRAVGRADRRFEPVAVRTTLPRGSAIEALTHLSGQPVSMGLMTNLFGVTARTIRFYEDAGLIQPGRNGRNRRVYGPRERERLETIILLRRASISLEEIRGVLAASPSEARAQAAELLDLQVVRLEAQLTEVEAIRQALVARLER